MISRWWVFASIYVLTWLPSHSIWQFAQYLLPVLLLIYSAFDRNIKYEKEAIFVVVLIFVIGAQSLLYENAGLLNYTLSVMTYSSLLLLSLRFYISKEGVLKILRLISIVAVLEFTIGAIQFITANQGIAFTRADAGDSFTGTIVSSSHLLAAKCLVTAIFLYYQNLHKGTIIKVGIITSLLSAIFASFLMGVVIVLAIWISIEVVQLKNQKVVDKVKYGVLLTVVVGIFTYTQSSNLQLVLLALESLAQLDLSNVVRFQKVTVLMQSLQDIWLSSIEDFLFGTGLGRFSSRSAMILSGGYLNEGVQHLVPISRTKETFDYIYSNWNPTIWSEFGGSIMAMPTSSIQAIIIELGLVGLWFLFFVGKTIYSKVNRMLLVPKKAAYVLSLSLLGLLITDMWLEYPSLMVHFFLFISITIDQSKNEDTADT